MNRYKRDISDIYNVIYRAHTSGECRRERIQDIDSWIKPIFQSLVAAPRLDKLVDLVLKDSPNGLGRVTFLELAKEGINDTILPSRFFVCFESSLKNDLKIGRRRCRWGSIGHRDVVGVMVT